MERVFLVLEVSEEDHRKDPNVGQDEESDSEPHGLRSEARSECDVPPEDQDVHAVIKEQSEDDSEDVTYGVHVETLVVLDILFEIGQTIIVIDGLSSLY